MKNILLFLLMVFIVSCAPVGKKTANVVMEKMAVAVSKDSVAQKAKVILPKKIATADIKDFATASKMGLPIVVELGADYCPACKKQKPIISELAKEYDGKVVFLVLDVRENEDIARIFGTVVIPTIGFFDKKGVPQGKLQGFQDKATLIKAVKDLKLVK